MAWTVFFAILAVIAASIRYGIYFYTIFKGDTKPHAFSWFLWGTASGIGTLAQFALHGGPSVYALGFVAITCYIVALIGFFIGEKDYTRSDWIALLTCFVAIFAWQQTNNPILAVILILLIDALTYFPTIRKSFHKPQSEPPISYGFAGLRYFLMLFAVPDPAWQTLMYPFFLMTIDWGFAVYIIIRRAQLGHPLHEYKIHPMPKPGL